MAWNLRVARLAGIDVYMHWTFLLLVAWFAFSYARGAGAAAGLGERLLVAAVGVGFVLSVFTCIVLHELGHALAARQFGIQTRDITLLPIGGLARLERMPDDPWQELWVALAGPLVNVAIILVLIAGLAVSGLPIPDPAQLQERAMDLNPGESVVVFLLSLVSVNVILVVFNLIPAFPMDGGRVLRALLAMRFDYAQATRAAASVGQLVAIGFAVLGMLSGAFMLIFVALFVFLGAEGEAQMAETKTALRGYRVRDAMMTVYLSLSDRDTLASAARELLAGPQRDFPVVVDGRPIGILDRATLFAALGSTDESVSVADVLNPDCPTAEADEPLEPVLRRMREAGYTSLVVVERGEIIGLLTMENVGELMALDAARQQRLPPSTARQMMTAG